MCAYAIEGGDDDYLERVNTAQALALACKATREALGCAAEWRDACRGVLHRIAEARFFQQPRALTSDALLAVDRYNANYVTIVLYTPDNKRGRALGAAFWLALGARKGFRADGDDAKRRALFANLASRSTTPGIADMIPANGYGIVEAWFNCKRGPRRATSSPHEWLHNVQLTFNPWCAPNVYEEHRPKLATLVRRVVATALRVAYDSTFGAVRRLLLSDSVVQPRAARI